MAISLFKIKAMKKVWLAVVLSTLYVIVFHLGSQIGFQDWMIFGMFLLSPLVVITLVWIILKHGVPSKYTFDERFYDDLDYKRNVAEKK